VKELNQAVDTVTQAQQDTNKPLAIILAGHNGSGKSTMWRERLSARLQIPLVNADRMMMSILPEVGPKSALPDWAQRLRDEDQAWMAVAQRGVQAFVAEAARVGVPFAMETVFSHWKDRGDGTFESKIDNIRQLQDAGYFVLLFFVGLESRDMSILRVQTRIAEHGHAVDPAKLIERFPRTQAAIREALAVADASILTDNSREPAKAFTVCRVQLRDGLIYDVRQSEAAIPAPIAAWLDVVAPHIEET
jgi:predicted ABC-type ATPase